jgi:hypothetical protein
VGREPMRVEVAIHCEGCDGSGLSRLVEAAQCEVCQGDGFWLADLATGSYAAVLMEVGRLHIEWLDYVAAMPDDSGESFAGLGRIDLKREDAIAKVRSHPSHAAPKEERTDA